MLRRHKFGFRLTFKLVDGMASSDGGFGREVLELIDRYGPFADVTDARLNDHHPHRLDVVSQGHHVVGAKGVHLQLLVALGVDLHASAELQVADDQFGAEHYDRVRRAEGVGLADHAGNVDPLLDH